MTKADSPGMQLACFWILHLIVIAVQPHEGIEHISHDPRILFQLPEHLIDAQVQRVHHAVLALVDDPERLAGDVEELFTTVSLPMMTRLRMPERQVLDTLVDSGVARSRSHALAWCVKLVGEKQSEWIDELRQALGHVEKARKAGPNVV